MVKLFDAPAIRANCLKKSETEGGSTKFSFSNPNELFDRMKLILQEKQTGNKPNKNDEGSVAKADKLLEYKCTLTKSLDF